MRAGVLFPPRYQKECNMNRQAIDKAVFDLYDDGIFTLKD